MQTKLIPQYRIKDFGQQASIHHLFKRSLDILFSLLLLILLAPLLLIIAILIKIESKGSIIYSQNRVGSKRIIRAGEVYWQLESFKMHKFRSMYTDSDVATHRNYIAAYIKGDAAGIQSLQTGENTSSYKLKKDPRVTKAGHYLRLFSLDELPQLWNILMGHMSFVGPRPPIDYELESYKENDLKRLATRPGLTGLWQVSGRTKTSFQEMVALDLQYIREQSLWFDLKILLLTVPAVFAKEGAG